MGLAALLTLAFVLVWPPVHQGFASSDNHGLHAGTPGHHAHIEQNEQNEQNRHLNLKSDADCDASAMGCCMMAHCCPGISVGPHDLPVSVRDDGATAASAVRGTGSGPGTVLPPPRRMPV
jgi:hypothetical protein